MIRGARWHGRKAFVLAFDIAASATAFYLALNFSYGRGITIGSVPGPHVSIIYTLVFAALAGILSYSNGLHRSIWRYTSLRDVLLVLRVATLTVLCFLPFAFLTVRANLLPRSTPILAWLLMLGFIAVPRILMRLSADTRGQRSFSDRILGLIHKREAATAVPVLIAGTTARIEPFIREMQRLNGAAYSVVGILTDEIGGHGLLMDGVPILGSLDDISEALSYLKNHGIRPQRLVIADDNANESHMTYTLELAARNGLTLGRLPKLLDFGSGESNKSSRVQSIALGDLLKRPQAVMDDAAVRRLVMGKKVVVTGAGGSIGSELVRQIAELNPLVLVLLDHSEFNLYTIGKEIAERHPTLNCLEALCDVRDRTNLRSWFLRAQPDIVFHAAALKHVPIVEAHPIEGIRTNILGTQNVADTCVQCGVEKMVLVSTDKAVNPHNVMGATKRSAEAYCQAMDAEAGSTRFSAVRFGNVLGSAGSVVPLFQRQLAAGGPLTVTHPEITRFFMTIPEAVSLLLQASSLGLNTDNVRGAVYVLDMGQPIKILDLAEQMIRLAGKQPGTDVKIEFVGLRPGEKLYEELMHHDETLGATEADGVLTVSPRTAALPILRSQFSELEKASELLDEARALRLLKVLVPEFQFESKCETVRPA